MISSTTTAATTAGESLEGEEDEPLELFDDKLSPTKVIDNLKQYVNSPESRHRISFGMPSIEQVQDEMVQYE